MNISRGRHDTTRELGVHLVVKDLGLRVGEDDLIAVGVLALQVENANDFTQKLATVDCADAGAVECVGGIDATFALVKQIERGGKVM